METYKFNFEKYTTLHRHYHNEINSANRALIPPLPEMFERVKVQHYLHGIKSPSLIAAIATVKATPNLKNDFNLCADYLTTFVTQNSKDVRNVSNLQYNNNSRGICRGRDRGCFDRRGNNNRERRGQRNNCNK